MLNIFKEQSNLSSVMSNLSKVVLQCCEHGKNRINKYYKTYNK